MGNHSQVGIIVRTAEVSFDLLVTHLNQQAAGNSGDLSMCFTCCIRIG